MSARGVMTHDEIAELAFATILICRDRCVTDPLRQAHAIAVAIKQAEADTLATDPPTAPDAATSRDRETDRKAEG